MKQRIFFFISVVCLWLPAATVCAEGLSLAELIALALKNNPETQKTWASVERAQAIEGKAKSGLYPHLDAQGSVTHAREVKFPNGPDTTFSSYGGELNLNYLLLDFGERSAGVRAAKEGLQAAKWWADFAIQRVMAEVSTSYYELLRAREVLETKECTLEDVNEILDAAGELRTAGLRSEHDYLTAKAAVSQVKMDVEQQRAQEAIAYGKLLVAMGLSVDKELEISAEAEALDDPLFEQGVSLLLATAEEKRADLMAKQAALAGMQENVTRAKRAPLPKLRALGQAGWLEYGKHKGNGYNFSAGLALDIPLFKGFAYTYQTREALAEAEITAAELKELHNAISLEVLSYCKLARASYETMMLSEDFFVDAEHAFEAALESYKAGLLTIFDLMQAQRSLADARNRKVEARTQRLVSLSQLAFATGSLSP